MHINKTYNLVYFLYKWMVHREMEWAYYFRLRLYLFFYRSNILVNRQFIRRGFNVISQCYAYKQNLQKMVDCCCQILLVTKGLGQLSSMVFLVVLAYGLFHCHYQLLPTMFIRGNQSQELNECPILLYCFTTRCFIWLTILNSTL